MSSNAAIAPARDPPPALVRPQPQGRVLPLSALLRGRSGDVAMLVASLKAELEEWVAEHPHDYGGLVLLGELNLRVGLTGSARELLYRASLLQPPSWEAMQRTSLLLRRAEAHLAHEVIRMPGAAPPKWLRRGIRCVIDRVKPIVRVADS
jgi:hypothetical protein